MSKKIEKTVIDLTISCLIFGYDGNQFKMLLVKPENISSSSNWSVITGDLHLGETLGHSAERILYEVTGLRDVKLEQLLTSGDPDSTDSATIISVPYFTFFPITRNNYQVSGQYYSRWFPVAKLPSLIPNQRVIVEEAKQRIRHKAVLLPILFNLLPEKFTTTQLQHLYEEVFETKLDNRNFVRKVKSSKLIIKLTEKDRLNSKRGAHYYKLDREKVNSRSEFRSLSSFMPYPGDLIYGEI